MGALNISTPARHRYTRVEHGLLLVVCGIIAYMYWRVLDYPFLQWDDPLILTSRAPFQQLAQGVNAAVWDLLSPALSWNGKYLDYLPIRDFIYAIDIWIAGGLEPQVFHSTNVLLHLANAIMVYWLARRFRVAPFFAMFSALCFGLHPLAVESVAWVSGLKDVLYSFFTLVAILYFLRMPNFRSTLFKVTWWFGFAVLLLLGWGSKHVAVGTVPLLIWLVLGMPRNRWKQKWLQLIPYFILTLGWVGFFLALGHRNKNVRTFVDGVFGTLFRALGAPLRAVSRYLTPVDLAPSYRSWSYAWYQDPHSWGMVCLLVLLGLLLYRNRLKLNAPLLLFGAAALAIAPYSGLARPVSTQVQADRYFYLSLVFLSVLLGWGLWWMVRKSRWSLVLALLVLSFFSYQTDAYLPLWKSDFLLWKRVYQNDPTHPLANLQLGTYALDRHNYTIAGKLLHKATTYAPQLAEAWQRLGLYWEAMAKIYRRQRHLRGYVHAMSSAESVYRKSLRIKPDLMAAHNNLGLLLWQRKDLSGAEHHLRKAYKLSHGFSTIGPQVAANLGLLLWKKGQRKEARRLVEQRLQRFPASRILQQWLQKYR